MTQWVRVAAALRAAVGVTFVSRPEEVARLLGAAPGGHHPVVRILGARHLAQAALLAAQPSRATVRASNAVDGLHVLSCVLCAAVVRARRTPAARDGSLDACVLLATWAAGR
jgi:hypothetical protein